jgi:alkylation response protein AidB-like acyl-CoA dehydrogenase
MDFSISEKMQTIIGMINEFVEKELIPLEPEFLTTPSKKMISRIEEKRKMVRRIELWAPNHPKEAGWVLTW